ncbi:disease resistance protein RPV1-like [Corylus avellana]|uniref:disease resistance protein RPV1-like n=1 Tax=Corylus avellana TaxID=13451 RepID=UPI00286BE66A|nr:disease resistance protein RPV1-like [Corylus avellana]
MAFIGDSSSSSSSVTRQWAHDVFLSFRGEDTRNNFTAHLYAALDQKCIKTYIDNALERGENISPALLKAIEESRISVIVLSQNYASSSWCLDELATILECKETKGQIVLPVFYKVDPSEVRYQRNSFEKAFVKHEKRFKDDQMKVQRWKSALTQVANLSGYDLKNDRNEHDFIQEIIERVNSILVKETCFQVSKYPVGIESRVQDVMLLLDLKKKDSTCMVGIVGTGGIGKTTLATAIYNSIASQFEGNCFLTNVRETFSQKDGRIRLQNILLSKILGGSSQMVDNVNQGVTLIENRLYLKRILLVLDDVDELVQLEMLAEKTNWFGLGSKIIITTRNKHLLRAYDGVVSIYPVKELGQYEALQLFSWYAFKSDKPNDGYVEVTEDALRYCGGLPLALTVLGSALKGRDIKYWKSKLNEYRRIPNRDIQKILRTSFDGLEENAKNIFLDIACFYKGEDVKYVREMLDSCGFHSNTGIDELKEKCLITESCNGSLEMHDLLQEMGREIVRQESPKNPGKRSRLWFHEDVRHVLEGDMGTNKVEGILIDLPKLSQPIDLSPTAFEKMTSLRLFICRDACLSGEPNFLSNQLRLIDWEGYPGEYFPPNFRGKYLVILGMAHSRIKILDGVQQFQNLTTMKFYNCVFLEKIPDVSRIPNLESLDLDNCKNLVEVHHSVGSLNKLNVLIIQFCSNLRSFPKSFKSRSLEKISFWKFSMLKSFPKIECLEDIYCCDSLRALDWGSMSTLYHLDLSGSSIVTLPRCIESFVGLKLLFLEDCEQLREILGLPPNVEKVRASGCVSLEIFLEGSIKSQLFNTEDPPEPMGVGTASSALQPVEQKFQLECSFNSLEFLDLSGSPIVSLPIWFNKFVKLEEFLTKIPDVSRIPNLETFYLDGCTNLVEVYCSVGFLDKLVNLSLKSCSKLRIFPRSLKLRSLIRLVLGGCSSLMNFPEIECQMECLSHIDVGDTGIDELPSSIGYLIGVKTLNMGGCRNLKNLPDSIHKLQLLENFFSISLQHLESLNLSNCKQLQEILELPPNVKYVEASGCESLAIFLEEARRPHLINVWGPPDPVGIGMVFQAYTVRKLDLSSTNIVTIPRCIESFVGLEELTLENCKQL